jgi:ankyrin repeat protein
VARYSRQDEVAKVLLEKGVELDIFAASMAGVRERVVELLAGDRGLVNSYSHDGWTPLHLAAFFGKPEIAEILLANGADVHARSTNAMQNTPLHAAVAGKKSTVASILIGHSADVNARQHGGWTALHAAAQSDDFELAMLLISQGADVKARADNHQSPLDLALTKGHAAIVQLLEEHGAA